MPKFRISWNETFYFDKIFTADSYKDALNQFESDFESMNFQLYFSNPKSIGVEGEFLDDSININNDCSGEIDENGDLIENL